MFLLIHKTDDNLNVRRISFRDPPLTEGHILYIIQRNDVHAPGGFPVLSAHVSLTYMSLFGLFLPVPIKAQMHGHTHTYMHVEALSHVCMHAQPPTLIAYPHPWCQQRNCS